MTVDKRMRFLKNLKGMTHKYFGMQIGFSEKTADIRMAQYESGTRTPKAEATNDLAKVLEVSPQALTVPDTDSFNGLMPTLFALEDLYGFRIDTLSDEICIRLDKGMGTNYITMLEMFTAWQKQSEKFKNGEISKEEYDQWRYNYPQFDSTQKRIKVASKEVSDVMINTLKDGEK